MSPKSDTTILLDIYERLGSIEQQLLSIAHIENDVKALKEFKTRLGAYIWFGGSVASGALFFIWEGLKYGIDKLHH